MAESVLVGCKLPGGIVMNVEGKKIVVSGNSKYKFESSFRKNRNQDVTYSDGLTSVPKDFAEKWFSQNADLEMVKGGFIYTSVNRNEATAKAKDTQGNRTGLEAMDPINGVPGVKPTDEALTLLAKPQK